MYQKHSIVSGIFCSSISKYWCQAQYFQLWRLKCHEDCYAIIQSLMKIHSHFRHDNDRKETHHNAPLIKTTKLLPVNTCLWYLKNHSIRENKNKSSLESPSPQTHLLNPQPTFLSFWKYLNKHSFQDRTDQYKYLVLFRKKFAF